MDNFTPKHNCTGYENIDELTTGYKDHDENYDSGQEGFFAHDATQKTI